MATIPDRFRRRERSTRLVAQLKDLVCLHQRSTNVAYSEPVSNLRPSFLRYPVTWPQLELAADYRALAERYRRMAEIEERPLAREGLIELARQCETAAEKR